MLDLVAKPARLDGEGASAPFLAFDAMADGDSHRLARAGGAQAAAAGARDPRPLIHRRLQAPFRGGPLNDPGTEMHYGP